MSTGILLGAAGCAAFAALLFGRWLPRLWLACVSLAGAAAFAASARVLSGSGEWQWRSVWTLGGQPVHLRFDALSALFLALVSVVGVAGAVYSRSYWSDEHAPDSAPRGRVAWIATLICMTLVLTASNGLHFLIAWELFAISAYFLLVLDGDSDEARSAGRLYLVASHAGTLCLFAFFSLLAYRTGSWDLGPMQGQAGVAPLFWLALLGFGVKAGLFPLHIWLPSAHANAPSHVSALMSGVAIKMGIYGILRFSGWLPAPAPAGWVLVGVGAISALFGIVFAFAQSDLKRLLAYCSVENIGIILMGIGGALIAARDGAPTWGVLLAAGALLHVWNHGSFKSLLFLGSGSIMHATGTRELSRLGGLWKRMPWTTALFALGAVAVSGLPPLNGFVSEWLVALGLFGAAASRSSVVWIAAPAAIALAAAGALALASFAKAASVACLGAPRSDAAASAHESPGLMRGPMVALGAVCATLALLPSVLWPALARAAAAWDPAYTSFAMPAPLAVLGGLQAAIAAAAVAAVLVLTTRAGRAGLRRALTWDCGYATPAPRIQYTAASFSGIAEGWFGWLLRPDRHAEPPRGILPGEAARTQRVPETVLEKVVGPIGGGVLWVSALARRLQHGRLQAYLLYILIGLIVLGTAVFLGALL